MHQSILADWYSREAHTATAYFQHIVVVDTEFDLEPLNTSSLQTPRVPTRDWLVWPIV